MKALPVLLLLLIPGLLSAQQPLEAPFRVNVQAEKAQGAPQVATNRSGEFVVVWANQDQQPPGSYQGTLYARRFGADGQPKTGDMRLAEGMIPFSLSYQVAMQDDGSFAVAFDQFVQTAVVFKVRWFTPDGVLEGEADVTQGGVEYVSMARLANGGIVLAWGHSFGLGAPTHARAYGPDRAPLGAAVLVDSTGLLPAVAGAPDGSFVVAWHNSNQAANFNSAEARVSFQRFAANGAPIGGIVDVTESFSYDGTEGPVFRIFAGVDGAGNVLVVWSRTDFDHRAPRGRWYAKNGAPLGREIRIAWGEQSYILPNAFALGEQGNFVLSWLRPATSSFDVYVRRYARSGAALGAPLKVNKNGPPGLYRYSTVGILQGGRFVVAWLEAQNDKSLGILARRFRSR